MVIAYNSNYFNFLCSILIMISRGRQLNITQGRTREGENDPEELQEDVLWSEEPEEEITLWAFLWQPYSYRLLTAE